MIPRDPWSRLIGSALLFIAIVLAILMFATSERICPTNDTTCEVSR